MTSGQRMHQRALFCTVTQEPGHGGIARVSSLLWNVMRTRSPDSWQLLTAQTPGAGRLTWFDKVRFSFTVIWRQLNGSCDVLFFDHLGLARVQRIVPRVFRRPYGVFLHSIEAWTPLNSNRRGILRNAKLRVANSNYTARRVAAAHPETGAIEVCQLTLGLNLSTTDARGCKMPAQVLERIRLHSVLIVGRMMHAERHKGHDELIMAWPSVLQAVPDAHLVVTGGGDDADLLKALAARLNVAEHIFFTGRVSDHTLDAIYSRAAVFAMPSRAEGFGMVYLEAMAHRLPCIGSLHDAAGEIIVDGETGFLVNQDEIRELASKIVCLLLDPELRERFGRAGLARVQDRFSLKRFEKRAAEVLEKLEA